MAHDHYVDPNLPPRNNSVVIVRGVISKPTSLRHHRWRKIFIEGEVSFFYFGLLAEPLSLSGRNRLQVSSLNDMRVNSIGLPLHALYVQKYFVSWFKSVRHRAFNKQTGKAEAKEAVAHYESC